MISSLDLKENKTQKAFTLAEVLITLGIIGVIAALTIPTLVKNYQKQQTAVKLEKMYSIISQAHKNAEVALGSSTNWGDPADSTGASFKAWWDEYFIPYSNLSIIKTCTGATSAQCYSNKTKYLNGNAHYLDTTSYYLVLKDGTSLRLWSVSGGSGYIEVDINGLSSPNVLGKDIFNIQILYKKSKIVMYGQGISRNTILLSSNNNSCNKDPETHYAGTYCGAVIQQDGWQIKDDYPWD